MALLSETQTTEGKRNFRPCNEFYFSLELKSDNDGFSEMHTSSVNQNHGTVRLFASPYGGMDYELIIVTLGHAVAC
jgi:hypothetical protein